MVIQRPELILYAFLLTIILGIFIANAQEELNISETEGEPLPLPVMIPDISLTPVSAGGINQKAFSLTGTGSGVEMLAQSPPTGSSGIEWQSLYGGNWNEQVFNIRQTADSGYIFIGRTSSRNTGDAGQNYGGEGIWVAKLDPAGILQCQKNYGGDNNEIGTSIRQISDNGYVFASSTYSSNSGDVGKNNGGLDAWIVRINESGSIQWKRIYGGDKDEFIFVIRQTFDNGYIFAGYTNSSNSWNVSANHGDSDAWIVKLDQFGALQWEKVIGGSGHEEATCIQQTPDGGYIFSGWSNSYDVEGSSDTRGGYDVWVVRLDADGNIIWQKRFGGTNTAITYYDDNIGLTSDGGYICVIYRFPEQGYHQH